MDASQQQTTPESGGELTLEQAMTLGIKLHQRGHPEEAEKIYRDVLDAFPGHPDALHFLGLARFALKDKTGAMELISQALDLSPEYIDAWINLGNIQMHQGLFVSAEQSYRRALALRPQNGLAWNNLGLALKGLGRWQEAVDALARAVSQSPDSPEFCQNLGTACCAVGDFNQGVSALRTALDLRPYESAVYQNLCRTLYILKEDRQAEVVVKRWLEHDPENPTARHLLAAYTRQNIPLRASDAYIQQTFDSFAEIFDEVLGQLDYQAPQQVAEALAAQVGDGQKLAILDAGCGTGLAGPLLRPYASRLTGADLSEKMLGRAAERKVYDELLQAELVEFMATNPGHFDAVVSVDTLVYFGALEGIAQAAFQTLRPGGLFVFSLEKAADGEAGSYSIGTHGRYSHTAGYVRELLQNAGFDIRAMANTVLRQESGKPVHGLVTTAAKP